MTEKRRWSEEALAAAAARKDTTLGEVAEAIEEDRRRMRMHRSSWCSLCASFTPHDDDGNCSVCAGC